MTEVYATCMNCGKQSLVKIPDWDEPLLVCPICGESMHKLTFKENLSLLKKMLLWDKVKEIILKEKEK